MLIPTITRQDDIISAFRRLLYSNELFYYTGYPACNELPVINCETGIYQYAIVDSDDKLIGFFQYHINLVMDTVDRFGLISFDIGNITVTLDAMQKMQELIRDHRRVTWNCIEGNPVSRVYDRICSHYNGYKSIMHKCTRNDNGEYLDSYVYEILNGGIGRED